VILILCDRSSVMRMPISNRSNVEFVTSVQRRRRWTLEEKIGWVRRAMEPGMSVSFAVREAGVAPS
jgi:transposase-like protein